MYHHSATSKSEYEKYINRQKLIRELKADTDESYSATHNRFSRKNNKNKDKPKNIDPDIVMYLLNGEFQDKEIYID